MGYELFSECICIGNVLNFSFKLFCFFTIKSVNASVNVMYIIVHKEKRVGKTSFSFSLTLLGLSFHSCLHCS